MENIVICENWGLHRFATTVLWPCARYCISDQKDVERALKALQVPPYVFLERP